MRTDSGGREIRQVSIWLPVEVIALLRSDRMNLSAFVREQLEVVYGDQSTAESLNQRFRLIQAARESIAGQREVAAEAAANRERLRDVVRRMRDDRVASATTEAAKSSGIRDALSSIVGEDVTGRYRRMLPENDPNGDRIDDWEALVSNVSCRCGTAVDPAEVAAELRELTAGA